MSRRIEELDDQAYAYANAKYHEWKQPESGYEGIPNIRMLYCNKLVELIVKECCSISDEAEHADVPVLASKFIKAHFGVE